MHALCYKLQVGVIACSGGSFVYFGVEKNLICRATSGLVFKNYPLMTEKLTNNSIPLDRFLSVSVNVDGLPLHNSTTKSFWPLLCILDQSVEQTL